MSNPSDCSFLDPVFKKFPINKISSSIFWNLGLPFTSSQASRAFTRSWKKWTYQYCSCHIFIKGTFMTFDYVKNSYIKAGNFW